MKNLGLPPQQLLAIKGLLNEGKINNLFSTPVESTVADHGGHGGKESKVKDSSRSSGVAHINAAVNHEVGGTSGANSNHFYDEGSDNSIPLGVGNSADDAKKFSARELLEKAGKGKKASQAQQMFRVSRNHLATFTSFRRKYIYPFYIVLINTILRYLVFVPSLLLILRDKFPRSMLGQLIDTLRDLYTLICL